MIGHIYFAQDILCKVEERHRLRGLYLYTVINNIYHSYDMYIHTLSLFREGNPVKRKREDLFWRGRLVDRQARASLPH